MTQQTWGVRHGADVNLFRGRQCNEDPALFYAGAVHRKEFSHLVVLLPIAVTANFAGIWMVKNVSTEHFYRITYILLFVLGSALCWQGTSHLLHAAA
jgi:hypothetical protein